MPLGRCTPSNSHQLTRMESSTVTIQIASDPLAADTHFHSQTNEFCHKQKTRIDRKIDSDRHRKTDRQTGAHTHTHTHTVPPPASQWCSFIRSPCAGGRPSHSRTQSGSPRASTSLQQSPLTASGRFPLQCSDCTRALLRAQRLCCGSGCRFLSPSLFLPLSLSLSLKHTRRHPCIASTKTGPKRLNPNLQTFLHRIHQNRPKTPGP